METRARYLILSTREGNIVAEEKIRRQGLTWRHVAVVITMMLTLLTAVGVVFTAAGLCYRPVAEHFGVQISDVSLYITFVYIGSMVGPIPAGIMFDKYNPKIVFTVAALLVVVPYLGFTVYPFIQCYWIAGFFIGLGLCTLEYTMTAGILSRWFHTNYGTVIGLSFAMTGVGGIIWNMLGQFILGPELTGWRTLYLIFGITMAVGTIPFILLFIKRTPEECGTLPYGMPIDENGNALVMQSEEGKEVVEEPGYSAKEVLRLPFFWTMLIGAGLLNTIATLSQLFATYVQFLGHEGWFGLAIVGLLLLSGTLESFASGGQMIGKILVGYIESRSLLAAQIMGLVGGVVGLSVMWMAPKMFGEAGVWPMFFGGASYGLMYACSTAMLPFLVREVFGGKDYDRIYSWQVVVFNAFGAVSATGWALVAQSFGWDAYFTVAITVVVLTFIAIAYTGIAGYKARAKTWYKTDKQLAADAVAHEA